MTSYIRKRTFAKILLFVLIGIIAFTGVWAAISQEITRQTIPIVERVSVVERSPCRDTPRSVECRQAVENLFNALPLGPHCIILRVGLRPWAYSRLTKCSLREQGGDAQRPPGAGQLPSRGNPG